MPPPSQLAIATSSVHRLVKEEASYHKELTHQEARIVNLESEVSTDENAEYQLKQERTALEETKAVFPPLRQRIENAVNKLEDQLEAAKENEGPEAEITKATEVIASAKKTLSESN